MIIVYRLLHVMGEALYYYAVDFRVWVGLFNCQAHHIPPDYIWNY